MGKYLNFVDKKIHLSNFLKQVINNSKYSNFIFIYPFIFFLSFEVLINNVADFFSTTNHFTIWNAIVYSNRNNFWN